MSSNYDHAYKIEDLNYKEGWYIYVFGSCTPSL
jgi:hypothetical protein